MPGGSTSSGPRASSGPIAGERGVRLGQHRWIRGEADLAGYAALGPAARTMGRDLDEDELFFAAPLAAGAVLARASLRRIDPA